MFSIEKPNQSQPYPERSGEMSANEKAVLDNVKRTATWLQRFAKEAEGTENDSPKLNRYLDDLSAESGSFERPADRAEMLHEAQKSEVVLLGDFHDLKKDQEFAAECIEELAQKSSAPKALAVEFIAAHDQKALDAYIAGSLSEEDFLHRVHFSKWDDPQRWEGYKKILTAAQESGIPVYGINIARTTEDDMQKEDEHIAANIEKISVQNPSAQIIVHIGEAHLAQAHLPDTLRKSPTFSQKRMLRIFQNIPETYFAALEHFRDFNVPPYLKVDKDTFHVLSAPLLTKFISSIEHAGAEDGGDYESSEALMLFTKEIARRASTLLKNSLPHSEDFPEFYSSEKDLEDFMPSFKRYAQKNSREYLQRLQEKGCVYIPQFENQKQSHGSAFLIQRFRLKHILEELARFINEPAFTHGDWARLTPEEKERQEVFDFFFSKLFIPERTPEDVTDQEGQRMFEKFLHQK